MLPIPPNKSLISYPLKQEIYGETRSGEWASSKKGSDRKSDRIRQKNKSGHIENCDQTGIPEISDRGKTS